MGVAVITPASSHDLTTYGLVALELGLSDGDTSLQARIDPLIAEVSDEIARHCGRTFARQTYTETLEGYGDATLYLTHRPIVSLTSVSLDGTAVDADTYSIISANGGQVAALSDGYPGGRWGYTAGYPRYTVVYTAGYILPGNAGENLPPALRRVATEVVVDRHINAGRDTSVTSRSMGDLSVTYSSGAGAAVMIGFPSSVVARLRPFMSRRFA